MEENIDEFDAWLANRQIFFPSISLSSIANIHCLDAIRQYFPIKYPNKANPSIFSPINKFRYAVVP